MVSLMHTSATCDGAFNNLHTKRHTSRKYIRYNRYNWLWLCSQLTAYLHSILRIDRNNCCFKHTLKLSSWSARRSTSCMAEVSTDYKQRKERLCCRAWGRRPCNARGWNQTRFDSFVLQPLSLSPTTLQTLSSACFSCNTLKKILKLNIYWTLSWYCLLLEQCHSQPTMCRNKMPPSTTHKSIRLHRRQADVGQVKLVRYAKLFPPWLGLKMCAAV